MLDNSGKLASIEGVLKDLLLKLGRTEASHVSLHDAEERRRKLLKMALEELGKLDRASADAAMSLEGRDYVGADPMGDYLRRFGLPRPGE